MKNSPSKRVYLDYAATTPAAPEVVEAMLPYFGEIYGNPASAHAYGKEAHAAVEKARGSAAVFLGAKTEEIVFTSGGTEGNNAAVKGTAYANASRGNHIITSAVEHRSVIEPCRFLEKNGFSITFLRTDKDGLVDVDDVRRAITGKTILISVMHANNEIGTLQPVEEIGKLARSKDICFHVDAVQTCGHVPLNVNKLHADLLSISSHKLYGPKGVGIFYIRRGTKITPFMHGGEQEKGRRASTHNVPGIVGFGRALESAAERMADEERTITALRNRLIKGILERIPDSKLNGHPTLRLPGNVNVSFAGAQGELLIAHLEREGIACSTGSACSASSSEPSHVLTAIGLSQEQLAGSLRFSLGRYVKEEDIDYVLGVLPRVVKKVRSLAEFFD